LCSQNLNIPGKYFGCTVSVNKPAEAPDLSLSFLVTTFLTTIIEPCLSLKEIACSYISEKMRLPAAAASSVSLPPGAVRHSFGACPALCCGFK
jgi:hypothetical protein